MEAKQALDTHGDPYLSWNSFSRLASVQRLRYACADLVDRWDDARSVFFFKGERNRGLAGNAPSFVVGDDMVRDDGRCSHYRRDSLSWS